MVLLYFLWQSRIFSHSILLPFDIFPGSSTFTCSPYLISLLFSIFSSHMFLLLILCLSFYLFSFSIHCLLQFSFPWCFYLSFTCLFPHIKKEPQHGSHPTPTQKLSCISLFWLLRSLNTMKHLLHSSSTTPQISLRKFWDLSHLWVGVPSCYRSLVLEGRVYKTQNLRSCSLEFICSKLLSSPPNESPIH